MSQTLQLVTTLKRMLRAQGITYAHVADHLALSEASVKRQFSRQSFSLRTLESICDLIGIELTDLAQAADESEPGMHQLTEAQESELVRDSRRLMVATCVFNHLTLEQIVDTYRLTKAQCIKHLLQLDRMGLIRLMPENRVKLRISRDFQWLPGGPIQRFFRERAQTDFLDASFTQSGELLRFQHAMLSPEANARFQQKLHRLVQEFTELHLESIATPIERRFGTSLLLAMRPWEPDEFESMRHTQDIRPFLFNGKN